tara:strand:+ start:636 stop:833 length:198 start_codon:yes stop_codon:yes gene_type:complete
MNYKIGDKVRLHDSGNIREAIVKQDGVDSQGRVRVRPSGFPFDISVTTKSDPKKFNNVYVITKTI